MFCCDHWPYYYVIHNFFRFALSITVFRDKWKFWFFFKFLKLKNKNKIFKMLNKVLLWWWTTHPCDPQISYSFWVSNFKLIFYKMATIWSGLSLLTRFLPKTNQRHILKVYWLFLHNFKSFHTAYRPVAW